MPTPSIEHKKAENREKSRKWRIDKPWGGHYNNALSRCKYPTHISYKRYGAVGIKLLMTIDDFKTLWFRDKAFLMKRPSIDRIDSRGDYEIGNCRFIELAENDGATPVIQMDFNGKEIETHNSHHEASRKTGVERSNISKCCRGEYKSAGGYKWREADE